MKNEYLLDNFDDETMIEMTDITLKYLKNKKHGSIKPNLLKIIPVAAAIVLVIGLINIFPIILNYANNSPGSLVENMSADEDLPNYNLKLGAYVYAEEPDFYYSVLSLSDNNEFMFMISALSSYIAYGTYGIENNNLILYDNSGEYIFTIKGDELIYQGGSGINVDYVKKGSVYCIDLFGLDESKYIDFNISIQPYQYNENPFKYNIVNTVINSVDELDSILSSDAKCFNAQIDVEPYVYQFTYFYDDEYFKNNALVAVTFEYNSIPKDIYKLEIYNGSINVWAYSFEDMSLPENEKFTSGLYTTRVFLIEVKKSDFEGITNFNFNKPVVYPCIDGAPTIISEIDSVTQNNSIKQRMTLEDIRSLAQKGDNLTAADIIAFDGEIRFLDENAIVRDNNNFPISGQNVYMWSCIIDDDFGFTAIITRLEETIINALLERSDILDLNDRYIDIRYDDVDSFINDNSR